MHFKVLLKNSTDTIHTIQITNEIKIHHQNSLTPAYTLQSAFTESDVTEQQMQQLKRDIFQRHMSHSCSAESYSLRFYTESHARFLSRFEFIHSSILYLPTMSANSPTVVSELLFMWSQKIWRNILQVLIKQSESWELVTPRYETESKLKSKSLFFKRIASYWLHNIAANLGRSSTIQCTFRFFN